MNGRKNGFETYEIKIKNIDAQVYIGDSVRATPDGEKVNFSDMLSNIHRHTVCELFFAPDNTIKLATAEGILEFTDSVIIVPPETKHFYVGAEKANKAYVFRVFAPAIEFGNKIISIDMTEKINRYVEEVVNIYKADNMFHDDRLKSFLSLIVMEITEALSISDVAEIKYKKPKEYVQIIEKIVNYRYTDKLTLTDVADMLHLSVKQTSRIIKQEYGKTLSQLFNEKKLSIACMLLRYTDDKIDDILSKLGIESKNYFFTLFKREYNMTPCEYREKYKH